MAQTTTIAPAPRTTLRPLHDRVLVKRLEEPADRPGRIVIPDSAKEKPQEGRVIAVGGGRVRDDEYLIMKEEDVLGVLGA